MLLPRPFSPRSWAHAFASLLLAVLPAHAQTPATSGAVAPYAPKAPESVTLKAAFKGVFHVGVALNPGQFTGANAQGAALVEREFDSISPENVLKWDAVESQNGEFRFAEGDRYVEFGLKNKMFIVGHNLCWHSQLPAWVSAPDAGQPALTKEVLLARLKRHVTTVAAHYRGKINGWDVVNEAITDAGEYRPSVFYKIIGPEYLPLAFKWAHEADPTAELYYNDYNLDASDAKRAKTIELVKYLREQGAPLDGIGMQGHYNLNTPTPAKIDETIRMFAALGLKVMITELDVQVARNAAITGAVGANATGAAAGGRARSRGRGGFPALADLSTALKLTDAQAAQIAPLLEKHTQNVAGAAGDFPKIIESRNATIAAIRPLLSETQVAPFNTLITPPAGGGAPVSPPPPPLTGDQQQALAKRYAEIFAVFLKHRDVVTRVTFWGLRDADSWRRNSSPLLFDDNYQRKPAYDGVISALNAAKVAKP